MFDEISKKQIEIFKFAAEDHDALICDGAVRSGKTTLMIFAYIIWAMEKFNGSNFGVCGKTVRSAERNIILPLLSTVSMRKRYHIAYARSTSTMTISYKGKINYFYLFGGKDESSYTLIQGITLCGVMFDEVALMPQSFVEQAIARTLSVDNSKLWFNCNPENPRHWFKVEWVDKPEKHNAKYIHLLMEDNPALSEKKIESAKKDFSGVFYARYILGLWVAAEGVIYPKAAQGEYTVPTINRAYEKHYLSVDYGTLNPFSVGLWGLCDGVWYRVNEYYYSGRESGEQLTDDEYYRNMDDFVGGVAIESIIVDPSAASFITLIKRRGKFRVRGAKNEVVDGIRKTAAAMQNGQIKINDCCKNILTEFALYRWDDKANEDRPINENDHAMDELRYFVNTVISEQKWLY